MDLYEVSLLGFGIWNTREECESKRAYVLGA